MVGAIDIYLLIETYRMVYSVLGVAPLYIGDLHNFNVAYLISAASNTACNILARVHSMQAERRRYSTE